ncbi:translation initiation factor IF-2 [endosymbiont of Sipalinus gigas]|uniref:translation initiation factor IF-2 n=1 Tax=endosymbiont of Sipalinus gigas TaxID=1972134 RepID=UPI000DC73099|nr:GTP-binding protein [endosymbiont of Sipalinus gigas]BBA85376.1 translation initiation factor IF-2 [endosymbiont of Sipalinus gigas]
MSKNNFKLNNIEKYKKRTPIITILGHVNHGKTSILNEILLLNNKNINLNEYGNITQYIKYFYIKTKFGFMTFLDTPGHEDFIYMRNIGAKITDIVILVIAADDGIKLQTIECINYIKNFNIPSVIVINKIDKDINLYNSNKIIGDLYKYNIISDKLGGEYQFINISSKNKIGIDNLLEAIYLQSEMINLNSNIESNTPEGIVLESFIDNRGPIISLIVKKGIFKIGDNIICNNNIGKIKLINSTDGYLEYALPSMPIEILGLNNISNIGEKIYVYNNKNKINFIYKSEKSKTKDISIIKPSTNDINIILKTNVKGICDVIINSLKKIDLNIKFISHSIGKINKNDINMAIITKSIILGFNIKVNLNILKLIKINNIFFENYFIIYDLIDKVKSIISERKNNIILENIKGSALVKNIFNIKNVGIISGCEITYGIIKVNNNIKIIRNNINIYEGKLESIKLFKENILEAKKGMKCGLYIKFNNIKINDKINSY